MLFIKFEPLRQKLSAFLSKLVFIYNAHLSSMVMSNDQRSKFRFILFCPNSTFNNRKCHKISGGKALYFRSYQQKTSRGMGVENTPQCLEVQ